MQRRKISLSHNTPHHTEVNVRNTYVHPSKGLSVFHVAVDVVVAVAVAPLLLPTEIQSKTMKSIGVLEVASVAAALPLPVPVPLPIPVATNLHVSMHLLLLMLLLVLLFFFFFQHIDN